MVWQNIAGKDSILRHHDYTPCAAVAVIAVGVEDWDARSFEDDYMPPNRRHSWVGIRVFVVPGEMAAGSIEQEP